MFDPLNKDDFDYDDGDYDDGFDSKESTGRWSREEHHLFIRGLELYGKGWKKIANLIKTRTVVQIRTHAQKYFQKLSKARQNGNDDLFYRGTKRRGKSRLSRPVVVALPLLVFMSAEVALLSSQNLQAMAAIKVAALVADTEPAAPQLDAQSLGSRSTSSEASSEASQSPQLGLAEAAAGVMAMDSNAPNAYPGEESPMSDQTLTLDSPNVAPSVGAAKVGELEDACKVSSPTNFMPLLSSSRSSHECESSHDSESTAVQAFMADDEKTSGVKDITLLHTMNFNTLPLSGGEDITITRKASGRVPSISSSSGSGGDFPVRKIHKMRAEVAEGLRNFLSPHIEHSARDVTDWFRRGEGLQSLLESAAKLNWADDAGMIMDPSTVTNTCAGYLEPIPFETQASNMYFPETDMSSIFVGMPLDSPSWFT